MYRLFRITALVAFSALVLSSCGNKSHQEASSSADGPAIPGVNYDSISYALGASAGMFMHKQNIPLRRDQFIKGLDDTYKGSSSFSETDVQRILNNYYNARQSYEAKEQLEMGERYLDSVSKVSGAQIDSSGLVYQVMEMGDGIAPNDSSVVEITYDGRFADGKQFDATSPDSPITLSLQQVIPGWRIGLPKIKEGGKIRLHIPGPLAYGPNGRPPVIPGNALLVFDVNLKKVLTPAEAKAYAEQQRTQMRR